MKFFSRQGPDWEFREELRKRVDLREMNLIKEWIRMPPLDIVFLRNVLIYFDVETKKAILAKVRKALRARLRHQLQNELAQIFDVEGLF